MLSSPLDHCTTAARPTRLCWLFNAPCTLVDVTVGNFPKMCLVGMKRVRYLSILWNQYSIIWIEIRSGEADSRVSAYSRGKRAGELSDSIWSSSPTDTRNPRGVTSAFPSLWERIGYLMDGVDWWRD
ncbi:hypothetical protein EVAR_61600_1 [Eumeta japonica]|uniref:Uncharacterized protein n=1 Tax=Eumeta variegata TaxID=151549 RepID=A0A4C1YM08_EUMVA|nr:hypothetical protein EVAR_61600_1 [Eumeta japonica]